MQMLKPCATEQQRKEYIILLRAIAPILKRSGDWSGMIKKVAAKLELPYGSRGRRGAQADYALTQAVKERGYVDFRAAQAARPKEELVAGDQVLCRGQLAQLEEYDRESGRCSVTFSIGEQLGVSSAVQKTVNYAAAFGTGARCARLQRPPVTLMPPPRKKSSLALSEVRAQHCH